MAAEAVASALLGAIFQSLVEKVNYDKFLDFCRSARVHSQAKNVKKLLQSLQKVLDVAEERQFEDVAVKDWVDDLRDVAYDLEVILDEFDTFQLQKELGIAQAASLSKLKFKWKFGSKVEEIARRLQDLLDRMEVLDLKRVSGMSRGPSAAISEDLRETTSALTDSGLFVRDAQKQKLIDLVLENAAAFSNTDSRRLHVLAVVGLGGMGKTTLAQRVYHDLKDSPCFDMKAWICISDRFQLMTIMENILREIGGDSSGDKSLQQVHKKIEEKIQGKTLLLFLDDAWERKHIEWERMWPLLHAAKNIIVVLTTRDQQVALSSGALRNELLLLDKLPEEDCFSVFQRYAFQNRGIADHPVLKDIGVQIVKKCDGSPLAAKILGSILRCESDEHQWKNILDSKLLAAEENSIRSILILSYHHLPMPLKQCFAFAAIFPKDYEFEEQQIVLLWMGQGFLHHSNQTELEDIGHNHFHDLLLRSFFQPSPNKTGLYVMHDLIHDLAQEVAGKTCFRLEEMMGDDQVHELSSTTRYASYIRCEHKAIEKFRTFEGGRSLQTFVQGPEPDYGQVFSYHVIDDTLCRLCHLRVLSLKRCSHIYELPDSVTKLKHLRHLDLSNTEIEVLQDSISTLVNLQTLLLRDCYYLVKLPHDLSNLVNLRHLDISGSRCIKEMSFGLNNLKSLRTLSNFLVGKDIKRGIQQLKDLNQIKGSLCISELQNVTIPGDASQAMLKEKTKLRTLIMRWTNSNVDSNFQNITENVFEELCPPRKLEKLNIENFMGTKFPRWFGDSSFSNITSLSLRFCEKCTSLPPLGKLPALKHLHIVAFKALVKVDSYFCGELFPEPFSSLETLEFKDMLEWEDWFISDEVKAFSQLKRLSICCCPKLSGKLPNQLLKLEEFMIEDCKSLVVSIPSTLKLQRLKINGCKEVNCNNFNDWSSLNSLILKNIKALSIGEELKSGLKELENLETDCLKLIRDLSQHPTTVKRMRLEDCSAEKLPQVLVAKDSSFTLEVSSCPNLISFPDEIEFSNDSGDSNSTLVIDVSDCAALEYIPVFKKMQDCCSILVEIHITRCGFLTGFARGLLPRTLKKLHIDSCDKLQCLVEEENKSNCLVEEENKSNSDMSCPSNIQLDELSIDSCDSLEYLASTTRGELPFKFKRLCIDKCNTMKSLIMSPQSSSFLLRELPKELESLEIYNCIELKEVAESFHINSNAIQAIRIFDCGSLKCLPKGLHNISNLKCFFVSNCEKLEAPPGCGIVNLVDNNQLAPLENLEIMGWPAGNASLLNEGGFQRINNTLTRLEITYPNTSGSVNKPISEWGLSRLVSLQCLSLKGESDSDVAYFPESISSALLPSSLTHLYIGVFQNLKYISCHVFKNLGSLQQLSIWDCPKLETFTKGGGGGLPLSLLRLWIGGCPKLEKRYGNKKKMKAKDWSKISHIPYIDINEESIHDFWLENN